MRFALPRLWPFVLLIFSPATMAAGMQEAGIAVIMANGKVPPALTFDELALIFTRKKRFWENAQQILPVNLAASLPLRHAFSLQLLGRSPEELEAYWRDSYFHGVQPPYVLASEEAVIRFVASTPGAIGYISRCRVDRRVTVVLQLANDWSCPR